MFMGQSAKFEILYLMNFLRHFAPFAVPFPQYWCVPDLVSMSKHVMKSQSRHTLMHLHLLYTKSFKYVGPTGRMPCQPDKHDIRKLPGAV